jgi:peptidoglycan/LPS O-acetylase OafA/YrhL
VQMLMFFIFVVLVVVCTLALGYGLSVFEERTISRRCRMPHEMRRRRKARRQRVRCRALNRRGSKGQHQ